MNHHPYFVGFKINENKQEWQFHNQRVSMGVPTIQSRVRVRIRV